MKRKNVDFEIMGTDGRIRDEGTVELTEGHYVDLGEQVTQMLFHRRLEFHDGETLTIQFPTGIDPSPYSGV